MDTKCLELIYMLVKSGAEEILRIMKESARKDYILKKAKNWRFTFVEILMFLFFEVDFSLHIFKQKKEVREILIPWLIDRMLNDLTLNNIKDKIQNISYKRMSEYGEVSDEEFGKNPSNVFIPFLKNVMFSIYKNDLFEPGMVYPIEALDAFSQFRINSSFHSSGVIYYFGVKIYLKYLFQDNSNFFALERKEINKRLNEAKVEIEKVSHKFFKKNKR